MKSLSNKKGLAVSLGLLSVAWCFIMFAVGKLLGSDHSFWGSITGSVISVVIAEIYLLFFRTPSHTQAVEVGAVSVYLIIGFFFISGLVNTVFILVNLGNFNYILIAVNVLIDVCFLIAAIYTDNYTKRVALQLEKAAAKTALIAHCSQTIGSMIAAAPTDAIKNQLISMKEAVDYSSNISTNASVELEQSFAAQLEKAAELLSSCEDSDVILQKLQQAEQTWKRRCSVVSALK